MNWEFSLLTAGIVLITAPVTTLISLYIKWLWEYPKIKGYFAFKDKSVQNQIFPNMDGFRVNTKKSVKRYRLSQLLYLGKQELKSENNEINVLAYKLSLGKSLIFIDIESLETDKIPKRVRQMIKKI